VATKLKIGVWILSEYKSQTGGGFSLYDKIIQLIDDYNFSEEIEVCFVGHKPASNYRFRKNYYCIYSFPFNFSTISNLVTKFSHKINFIGNREGRILKKNDIGVIYYPVQGFKKVKNFPFVTANWDIGHKSNYAFPEFALNGKFEFREKWYGNEIYKALMVFSESEEGKKELINYTKINQERIGIVPLFPGGVVDLHVDQTIQLNYLQENNLTPKDYFFYPAQFWAHKNHYNLLLAFREFVAEYPNSKLVLSGSDKGNKNYIQELTNQFGLNKNVLFTGFVSNEEIYTLYKNALALVMPSLTGATNMPLLEAREISCPVICSDLEGHKEIMKDGAFYFNGLDYRELLTAMKKMKNENERDEVLSKAKKSLENSIFTSQVAIRSLEENFIKLKAIRLCWGKNDKIF
jgi:glycosyltransferase involved in cell wall biosynthesis